MYSIRPSQVATNSRGKRKELDKMKNLPYAYPYNINTERKFDERIGTPCLTDVDGAVPVQLCGGGGVEHADADRRDVHTAERLQEADAAAGADGGGRDHRAHVQGGARQEEHCRAGRGQNRMSLLGLINQ